MRRNELPVIGAAQTATCLALFHSSAGQTQPFPPGSCAVWGLSRLTVLVAGIMVGSRPLPPRLVIWAMSYHCTSARRPNGFRGHKKKITLRNACADRPCEMPMLLSWQEPCEDSATTPATESSSHRPWTILWVPTRPCHRALTPWNVKKRTWTSRAASGT